MTLWVHVYTEGNRSSGIRDTGTNSSISCMSFNILPRYATSLKALRDGEMVKQLKPISVHTKDLYLVVRIHIRILW